MSAKAFFAVALLAAVFVAGCVQQAPALSDPRVGELNATVNLLRSRCLAAEAEKQGLQSSLEAANAAKAECEKSLAQTPAPDLKIPALQRSLADAKLSNNPQVALDKYAEMDNGGCLYYIGVYGFFQNTNVTIPLGCALIINNYLNSSRVALQESVANLNVIRNASSIADQLEGK